MRCFRFIPTMLAVIAERTRTHCNPSRENHNSLKPNWQKHVFASSGHLELGMFDDAAMVLEEIAPEDKSREVLGAGTQIEIMSNYCCLQTIPPFARRVCPLTQAPSGPTRNETTPGCLPDDPDVPAAPSSTCVRFARVFCR